MVSRAHQTPELLQTGRIFGMGDIMLMPLSNIPPIHHLSPADRGGLLFLRMIHTFYHLVKFSSHHRTKAQECDAKASEYSVFHLWQDLLYTFDLWFPLLPLKPLFPFVIPDIVLWNFMILQFLSALIMFVEFKPTQQCCDLFLSQCFLWLILMEYN